MTIDPEMMGFSITMVSLFMTMTLEFLNSIVMSGHKRMVTANMRCPKILAWSH